MKCNKLYILLILIKNNMIFNYLNIQHLIKNKKVNTFIKAINYYNVLLKNTHTRIYIIYVND